MIKLNRPVFTDRFVTTNFGHTLMLKACGFIEEQRAKIVNVEPSLLELRIGVPWPTRILSAKEKRRPVDIRLDIADADISAFPPEESCRFPSRGCKLVNVTIQARFGNWKPAEFHQLSRNIMWSLRDHFISPG